MNKTVKRIIAREGLIILMLLLLTPFSLSHTAEVKLYNELPVKYTGSFQWKDGRVVQQVEYIFEEQHVNHSGEVELRGKGLYSVDEKTHIKIKCIIDPITHRLEIWEFDPSNTDFITDGSHVGWITQDLSWISAMWTTKEPDRKGVLVLSKDSL